MLLRALVATLFVSLPTFLSACDACGCGIGGGGFGLLSVYRNNYVGLSYGRLPFKSRLTSGEYTGTEDVFHQIELQGRYEVVRGLRVDAFVPYRHNSRFSPDGNEVLSGLGDLRLGAAYILSDNRPLGNQGGSWYWEMGVLASLPTASYDDNLLDSRFLPDNFNLGKGAAGAGLQTTVVLSTGRFGLALNTRHMAYGKSGKYYRFGSETSLGGQFFGQFSYDPHWKIIPFAGATYERVGANETVDDLPVHGTGGSALLGTLGVNVRYDDVTLSARIAQPVSQDYSDGMVEAGLRSTVTLLYNF